jgi:lipopolysaccharide biosynthesis glycosyltransferase
MDGGLSNTSWSKLGRTLQGLPVSIQVLKPERTDVSDLGISHHITHTAYYRLLAARLLPESLERVIYLDADVLLRDDLSQLWSLDIGNHFCLAAADIACPFIDARFAPAHLRRSIPYLATLAPVPNWKSIGLNPAQPYFNSGVMVLNLKRWREADIEQELLSCLRVHARHVWCWDQYALNVVFAGQWQALPARWNQGAHLFDYPDESCSPVERDDFRQMRDRPALIHFTSEFKPWLYHSTHPLRELWFEALDHTDWSGWRPDKPHFRITDWWTRQAVRWSRQWIVGYRKVRYAVWNPRDVTAPESNESVHIST